MTSQHSDGMDSDLMHTNEQLLRDREYCGGFYLTNSKLDSVSHFQPFQLRSNWTFWHDSRGNLEAVSGQDRRQLMLFGTFFHLEESDPKDMMTRLLRALELGTANLEAEIDLLVGRFVLVIAEDSNCIVYNDAMGTRSVYYATNESSVASHYNLLAETVDCEQIRTWDEARMSMDLTKSAEIRQLLPNFRLDCSTRDVERYFPRRENEFDNWSHEEKQAEISRLWKRSLEALFHQDKSIVFSITGGLDSRLSVSMAHEHWNQINLYTYGSKQAKESHYSRVMNRDYAISQQLVEIIEPQTYVFIALSENKKVSTSLSSLLKRNSITKHGYGLVQRYREEFPGDDWIHVRSTGMEVMRCYFGIDQSIESIIRTCEKDGATGFLSRIGALGYDAPQFGYNKKDLLYWELRMGKWHSEILNENDAAFETVLPHNNRRLIKLFLSYSDADRRDAFALKELINSTAPLLNFFGINDTRNLYEIIRDTQLEGNKKSSDNQKPMSTKKVILQTFQLVRRRGVRKGQRMLHNLKSRLSLTNR